MHVLITCRYKRYQIKTAEKKWHHRFPHYKSIFVDFIRRSRAPDFAVGVLIMANFERENNDFRAFKECSPHNAGFFFFSSHQYQRCFSDYPPPEHSRYPDYLSSSPCVLTCTIHSSLCESMARHYNPRHGNTRIFHTQRISVFVFAK